jgi:hypothetical protein
MSVNVASNYLKCATFLKQLFFLSSCHDLSLHPVANMTWVSNNCYATWTCLACVSACSYSLLNKTHLSCKVMCWRSSNIRGHQHCHALTWLSLVGSIRKCDDDDNDEGDEIYLEISTVSHNISARIRKILFWIAVWLYTYISARSPLLHLLCGRDFNCFRRLEVCPA